MYLPYIAGMVVAKLIGNRILRSFPYPPVIVQLIGLSLSLLILLIPTAFVIGLFFLSFCHAVISGWLNRVCYDTDTDIPMDQRVIIKFTTQNKGSVVHQFLLMGLLLVLTRWLELPVAVLLQLTDKLRVPTISVQLMEYAKWGNISWLLLGVLGVYLLWKREVRHHANTN